MPAKAGIHGAAGTALGAAHPFGPAMDPAFAGVTKGNAGVPEEERGRRLFVCFDRPHRVLFQSAHNVGEDDGAVVYLG
jgi:hypothetical protein